MNIGCSYFDGALEQLVDRAHNRCAGGHIAQHIEIIIIAAASEVGGDGIDCAAVLLFSFSAAVTQQLFNLVEGGDFALGWPAERQLDHPQNGRIGRVRQRQMDFAAAFIWIGRIFTQKAWREAVKQRLAGSHGAQCNARQVVENGDSFGKSRRLLCGLFQQLTIAGLRPRAGALCGRFQHADRNEVVLEAQLNCNRHQRQIGRISPMTAKISTAGRGYADSAVGSRRKG